MNYTEDQIREAILKALLDKDGPTNFDQFTDSVIAELNKPKHGFEDEQVVFIDGDIYPYKPAVEAKYAVEKGDREVRGLSLTELGPHVREMQDTLRVLTSEEFIGASNLYEDELLARIKIAQEALAAFDEVHKDE